jgi:exodeoxyribonuclease V alpha subunit
LISAKPQTYSRLDYGFAQFFSERSLLQGEQKLAFHALLLELSAQQSMGHSCLALSAEDEILAKTSGLTTENQLAPFIIDEHHLYLQRYWQYEQNLAQQLSKLSQPNFNFPQLEEHLALYFPSNDHVQDWQKQAAKQALCHGLTIISGGPGTGKTTTVVKILALLQETAAYRLQIALAAPTGKAAMRLQEAIAKNKTALPSSDTIKALIPETVTTLHRLLGPKVASPYFKHNAERPLPYDVLVIDESSMVDLALMSKVVDALKPQARLILLGDKDQLASVESGAVLADISLSMPEHTVELIKSHRFQGEIKQLADAVNQQNACYAWQLLNTAESSISLLHSDPVDFIVQNHQAYLQLVKESADFLQIFQSFNQFQVLCANKNGPNSVVDINRRIEQYL